MTNKSALITGAAKRIGSEIAIGLAKRGFDIALHYYHSEKEAVIVQKRIEEVGRKCVLFQCALQDKLETLKLIEKVKEHFPELQLLINNASVYDRAGFLDTSLEIFENNFAVHVQAPFFLTAQFAKLCKQGNVINIIDSRIVKTEDDHFAYLLSKKTLYELTRLTAKSLAPNIRVNAIAPGSTAPPIDTNDPQYMAHRAQQVPLHIKGSSEYLLQGIDFLLNNSFVTGECLFIDGGAHIEH